MIVCNDCNDVVLYTSCLPCTRPRITDQNKKAPPQNTTLRFVYMRSVCFDLCCCCTSICVLSVVASKEYASHSRLAVFDMTSRAVTHARGCNIHRNIIDGTGGRLVALSLHNTLHTLFFLSELYFQMRRGRPSGFGYVEPLMPDGVLL